MARNWNAILAGALFTVCGLVFVIWSLLTLRMGTAQVMGPGFFPTVLSCILVLLGLATIWKACQNGFSTDDIPSGPMPWRAIILVGMSPVVFALSVERIGLILACFLSLLTVTFASSSVGVVRGLAVSAALTAFCVIVFSYGAGLPIPLTWR